MWPRRKARHTRLLGRNCGRGRDGPCTCLAPCDPALPDSSLSSTERAGVSKFHAATGLAVLFLLLDFFVNEWAPRGP